MAKLMQIADIAARAIADKPRFNVPWRPAVMTYANAFSQAAAHAAGVDPCMLAAIAVRESGAQNILQYGVSPGPGCGVGLCQITSGVDWSNVNAPSYPGYGALLDPLTNLRVAAEVFLVPLLAQFPASHLAAFAAYNLGAGAVAQELAEGVSPDTWTTGNDYGADVFTDWINFNAASIGVLADWTTYRREQTP